MTRASSGLRVCIHRGASEIGGSCVELEARGQRLVLDLGLPLDTDIADDTPLPNVSGLDGTDSSLLGVVITHGHPDHWGLAPRIDPKVSVYMGETTSRVLREAEFFTPTGADFRPAAFLRHQQPLAVGPFMITPHLVDHSAFDAYAIEVEAEGKRLLYSGDLRAHGRRQELLAELARTVARPVDVLLLEGTRVRRQAAEFPQGVQTEQDVENRCSELFAKTQGLVLAAYSPQNVDRMITLYRAARSAGRKLVMDLYAASIAAVVDDPDVPKWDSDDVLVYVPQAQRIKVKRATQFERVNQLRERRIYDDDFASRAGDLVLTFRASMTGELQRAACLEGAAAVWSLWPGYLRPPDGDDLVRWLSRNGIPLAVIHASGHASVEDLQDLARAIDAAKLVPIHTETPERYHQLFARVSIHSDGERWSV